MAQRNEIVSVIVQHLENTLDDPPPLDASSAIVDDAQLDSMQSFEMIAALEDHYEIDIPLESMQDAKTIQDVADSVHRLLQPEQPADA